MDCVLIQNCVDGLQNLDYMVCLCRFFGFGLLNLQFSFFLKKILKLVACRLDTPL
jgi:hypothetical protein